MDRPAYSTSGPLRMSLHFNRLSDSSRYPGVAVECLDDNVASEFVSGTMPASAVTKVEHHLASCRDCRALVAALAGADDMDSNAATHRHEKEVLTESQVGKLPVLAIGDRVGRYLVLSTLGSGGMGHVFAAYDPQLDRKIALKVLRANLGANAKEARARLKREAQAIAQLNHPNVVGVYDVGTTGENDDVYIAMEFVEGDTLTTWLKRWPRTWREILEVFHQAARGLMAAHSVGLLHRDFKPDNVLVGSDGRVRVTDFGLARSLFGIDDSGRGPTEVVPRPDGTPLQVDLTATGTVLGTPRYMPPEQLMGPNIDARSDQFSFCVALYEALFTRHPLEASTSVAMLEKGTPALPPPEGTRVPSSVQKAVMRGLAKERSQRWPTMAALVTELTPPVQHARGRMIAVAFAGVVVLGVAGAAVLASHRPKMITTDGTDTETIRVLVDQINILETQVKQDRKKLLELDLLHDTDAKQIEHDKQELLAKETRIQALVEQVTDLKLSKVAVAPRSAVTMQGSKAIAAVATAQQNLEGCFDEWASRPLTASAIGSADSLHRANDSDVLVVVQIGPDGKAIDATSKGEDTDRSPSLKLCVEGALANIAFPPGPEIIDLEVEVVWAAPDIINTSARVTGHRELPAP
jgi:serine/threonine protein kinase